MKLALAALAALTVAGSAHALSFDPKSEAFSLQGSMTFDLNHEPLTCPLTMTGQTHGSKATITGVSSSGGCSGIVAYGLPWNVRATGPGAVEIKDVKLSAPADGQCLTSVQSVAVNKSGVWTFTPAVQHNSCAMSGALPSSPAVKLRP